MSVFKAAREAAREVWQRSVVKPLRSEEELKDLQMAMDDLEHAYRVHLDAAAKERGDELTRVAS